MLKKAGFFRYILIMMAFIAFVSIWTGCRKEKLITDSSAQLSFSEDTIIFDTVFTTVGSTTAYLKVYNPHKGKIRISELYIESGLGSNYRLNVDGVPGKAFSDIEIDAKDSLFIFVEVTVDPNNINTPLIVSDRIIFKTNGNTQHVDLVAWGQDAYFFKPSPGSNAFLMPCDATLLTDKPIVFYGIGLVGENCCLTIPAGAKVYFHPGSALWVYKGCLNVNGTATNKVVFQGDRLEYAYRYVPGQWEGIRFIEAENSIIEHAEIKNGFYGCWVDTTFGPTQSITLSKTEIHNMASIGIYGNAGANINATNCLVKDCGLYGLALTYGGIYNFNHCTFGNYWSEGNPRNTPNFYMKNWFEISSGVFNIRDLDLEMDNCIIYGNLEKEFETDIKTGASLFYEFRNCFIKTDQDISDGSHYISIQKNVDPGFEDAANGVLKLLSGSAAVGTANFNGGITEDILENPRDSDPDAGCYEFQ